MSVPLACIFGSVFGVVMFLIGFALGWTVRSNKADVIDRIDREIAEIDRRLAEMPDDADGEGESLACHHPETKKVKARDVKPYEWALWCSIMGSEPFANDIVSVHPSECGAYLWFMLDSHNFLKATPDEELELIPLSK